MQTTFSNSGTVLIDQTKESGSIQQMPDNSQKQIKRGYDFYELLSALQKDIRRGNEYEAVFWAVQLDGISSKALWNRLRIIASEDVGVANSLAPLVIDMLKREYCDAKGLTYNMEKKDPKGKTDDSYRLFLVNAVLYLARSPKSRIVDDLLVVVYGEIQYEDKKLTIPDYALDKHTLRGKKMGRGWEHFFSEGNRLSNETIENPYTAKAKKIRTKYGDLKPESPEEKPIKGNKRN
jgi:replication-associated recombination protein RarA